MTVSRLDDFEALNRALTRHPLGSWRDRRDAEFEAELATAYDEDPEAFETRGFEEVQS